MRALRADGGRQARRACPKPHHRTLFSGIDFVEASDDNRPLIVGERTNEVGSRQVQAPDHDGEVRRGERDRAAAGEGRRADHRREPPERRPRRAVRHRSLLRAARQEDPRADHDRHDRRASHRALADLLPGQVDHQLDQPRRRARQVRARDAARAQVRRGADRRLHRRGQGAGAGDHARAQARDRRALVQAAHRGLRHPRRGHHLRPARLPLRDRRPELRRQRRRDDRRHPADQGSAAAREDDARHQQRLLRPARRRTRSAELGLPLSLHESRPRSRDRQRREARALRLDPRGRAHSSPKTCCGIAATIRSRRSPRTSAARRRA